jgi:hypothetical protein
MLDYSSPILESSSTQKWTQFSEYRVLDTRHWNHYMQWYVLKLKKETNT